MFIYEDNSAAISLSETSVIGKRTRHIDIKYKFLNESVELGKVKLVKIEGAKNVADIFTKPLARDRFRMLAARMAHSTSLLVPQPMTMDQDGPSYCMVLKADGKSRCRAKQDKQFNYCKTHLLQQQGHTCAGTTMAGNPCLAGPMHGSQYCDKHGRGRSRGRTSIPLDPLGIPMSDRIPIISSSSSLQERFGQGRMNSPSPYSTIMIKKDGRMMEIKIRNKIGTEEEHGRVGRDCVDCGKPRKVCNICEEESEHEHEKNSGRIEPPSFMNILTAPTSTSSSVPLHSVHASPPHLFTSPSVPVPSVQVQMAREISPSSPTARPTLSPDIVSFSHSFITSSLEAVQTYPHLPPVLPSLNFRRSAAGSGSSTP